MTIIIIEIWNVGIKSILNITSKGFGKILISSIVEGIG